MIKISQISKSFGPIVALKDITFHVEKGSIAGVLGPNGAGKTTLFKILTGLIEASSGEFEIESQKKKKVGAIIENPHLYEYLNALQNLSILARYQGLHLPNDHLNQLLENVGLNPDREDPVRNFSLGMKQRLGIATALLNEPDVLILDEPFLGLDPIGMKDLRQLLKELTGQKGMCILISSHQLEELSKVCDQLFLLNQGKITANGSTAEILHRATQKFRFSGPQLHESELVKKFRHEHIGDLILIHATKEEANQLLKELIHEGVQIDDFGPELNLENIYDQ